MSLCRQCMQLRKAAEAERGDEDGDFNPCLYCALNNNGYA